MILRYNVTDATADIVRGASIDQSVWNRITELALSVEPDAIATSTALRTAWSSILAIVPQLAILSRDHAWSFVYEGGADEQLRAHRQRRDALRLALSAASDRIDPESVEHMLADVGFRRREGLRDFQREQIASLMAMSQGANFSVPGAGKTTVALAVHALLGAENLKLLVVAPKNAFSAWDEAVEECIEEDFKPAWRFRRLTGGFDAVSAGLFGSGRNFIISYDQLIRVDGLLLRFLALHNVHMILDESHRIKGGQTTARGQTIRRLQHLPVRRDILSGTPMPHSIRDIIPQISFLWPGERLGERAAEATNPNAVLRPLYVRATKNDLGLDRPSRDFVPIPMSANQLALYGILRSELISRAAGLSNRGAAELRTARRSIMRLLQASSNPALAVSAMLGDGLGDAGDPRIASVTAAVMDEGDSPKLRSAEALARRLIAEGRKVVIWSMFTRNVERLAENLADIGAVFIHGGVDAGAQEDEQTRENALYRFKTDASCRVLVANPAACGEGISLHQVCHDAIYLDRSFNAAHYLQSVDRIHRLGLPPGTETNIYVLETVAPGVVGSIDYSVRRRLSVKLRSMAAALSDRDLELLALDEEDADMPVDFDIDVEDILDVINELTGSAPEPSDDEDIL